jgi:hypothetical protein
VKKKTAFKWISDQSNEKYLEEFKMVFESLLRKVLEDRKFIS